MSYLAPGLTREAASLICRERCRAQCCRGPLSLSLTAPEVASFRAHAAALRVELNLVESGDGSGTVVFLDHAGDRCPMLDEVTSACRIYADRPGRCREFPDRPRPGCEISGGESAPHRDDP